MTINTLSIQSLDAAVKATADVNRIRILSMLQERKLCVCEIAFVLGITQPSVSRHLKKLKAAGFIEGENEGLWTYYSLAPRNAYAKQFIKQLKTWVAEDTTVCRDRKKIAKTDKASLCAVQTEVR